MRLCRRTAPTWFSLLAVSTAECSLRPGRPSLGLPMGAGYAILSISTFLYLAQSILTQRTETFMVSAM